MINGIASALGIAAGVAAAQRGAQRGLIGSFSQSGLGGLANPIQQQQQRPQTGSEHHSIHVSQIYSSAQTLSNRIDQDIINSYNKETDKAVPTPVTKVVNYYALSREGEVRRRFRNLCNAVKRRTVVSPELVEALIKKRPRPRQLPEAMEKWTMDEIMKYT